MGVVFEGLPIPTVGSLDSPLRCAFEEDFADSFQPWNKSLVFPIPVEGIWKKVKSQAGNFVMLGTRPGSFGCSSSYSYVLGLFPAMAFDDCEVDQLDRVLGDKLKVFMAGGQVVF